MAQLALANKPEGESESGRVVAFDVQQVALDATLEKLHQESGCSQSQVTQHNPIAVTGSSRNPQTYCASHGFHNCCCTKVHANVLARDHQACVD